MFNRIRLRLQDMKTLSALISGADEQARLSGEAEPGAEHFLLSAFALPEGSARRVFEGAGANPDQLREAIMAQYREALATVGFDTDLLSPDATSEPLAEPSFPRSQASGQAFMKGLHALKKLDKENPILGAHVVSVVASMDHGVAARALRSMGLERNVLAQAVEKELAAFRFRVTSR